MRWLLRALVSEADRRAIESDLAELHELRRRQHGAAAADRWLRRQRRLYPWLLLLDRVRGAQLKGTTMRHLWPDVRYTLRSLSRAPALAATIVLTVGVGLGATVAAVALIRAVIVNPLPYHQSEALVWIYTDNAPYRFPFSVVDYRALEADHPAFSAVAAYRRGEVTVTERDNAERVAAKVVTGSYFSLLGQRAHIGRLFVPSDEGRAGGSVVLTHAYWTRRFGSDPGVLGRAMTIDGARATIVGVLQRSAGPLEQDVALFTAADWPTPTRKGPFFLTVLGRLRPGVAPAAAFEALRATNARLFPLWQSSYQNETATWGVQDLRERVVGDIGATLAFVLAAVATILAIACANAVNLLVARALNRGRELAIRGALGASHARLLQHVLVEAGVLTLGAALVGAFVALVLLNVTTAYGAPYIPRIGEVRLSAAALAWLAGLALASGVAIGIVPAWHGLRLRVDRALKASGRSSTDGPAARRLRRVLVGVEFALATPLLVAMALLLASLDRLSRVPVGIDTDRLLTASIALPASRYPAPADREAFWKRALDRAAALPGVERVALADSRPPQESGNQNNFDLEDRPTPANQNQPVCTWVAVSLDFFRTVGLRLEQGRLLDSRSVQEDVVVVDRAWAHRFFPGETVLGRRFRNGGCTTCPWTTVVGVVDNVKWVGLDAVADGTVYYPFVDFRDGFVVLRTTAEPSAASSSLRQAVRELDPALALSEVATGDDLVGEALSSPRYLSVLVAILALAALVLSLVGIYGVMAYFVQQHTRDIGIRLALGGDPAAMRRMVVVQGLQLVAAGVVVGIVAALLASRLVSTLLFGVSATDLRVVLGVPAALVAVALAACLVPAHRAAGIDPATILRES